MVSRSRTHAPSYDVLTLGGAELEKLKSLGVIGVTLDCFLVFEAHLCNSWSKVAKSLGVVHSAGKLFDYPRVLKSCFNAYVLFSL